MQPIIHKITVDISGKPKYKQRVLPLNLVRDDNLLNIFEISVKDDGTDVALSDITRATVTFLKDDGNPVIGDAVVDDANNVLTYAFQGNELSFPGNVLFTVELYKNGGRQTSGQIKFKVVADLDNGSGIPSTPEYAVLTQLINDTQASKDAAYEAATSANSASQSAHEAASSVQGAIDGANNAAGTANTAATNANDAATNANNAATAANTAAQNANNAADTANTSAANATQTAETAAQQANDDVQNFISKIVHKGAYSPDVLYEKNNEVLYQGSTYRNTVPCKGILPTNTANWQLVAQKGIDGLGSGDMTKDTYDPNNDGIVLNADHAISSDEAAHADAADSVPWVGVTNPPTELIESAQSTLHEDTLSNIVSIGNDEKKAVAVGLKGRTVINLLGNIGDCENTDVWGTNSATAELDSSNKAFGNNSIKVTGITSGGINFASILRLKSGYPFLNDNKYYCISAYFKNGNTVGGAYIMCEMAGESPVVTDADKFVRTFIKISPAQVAELTSIQFIGHVTANAGQYFWVDGIMVNEITEEEYSDPNYEPPEYVNGNVDVVNPVVVSHGKNLCPSFDKWFIPSGYILVGSNTIQTSIESDWKCQSQVFAVKPNTQYAISADITGPNSNVRTSIIWLDKNKAFVFNDWLATVSAHSVVLTSPPNAYYAYINLLTETGTGLRTFSNIQLEESSVATEYEPYKGKGVQVPYTLRECGGARDEITKDGKVIGRVGYKVLDGSLEWVFHETGAGMKQVRELNLSNNIIDDISKTVYKYNGKKLLTLSNIASTPDSVFYGDSAVIHDLFISVSNSDSGWGDAYTPTPEEIKAYFNGWIMRSSSGTQYNDATGSEVKRWQAALSNINAPWNPTGEDDYNTGICPSNRIAPNYTPYRLYYQLAQPIIEDIPPILLPVPPQGSISVDSNIMPLLNYELMDNARAQIDSIMDGLAGVIGSIKNKARYTIVTAIYSQAFANDELIPVYWQNIGESTCDGTFNFAYPTRLTVPRGTKKVRVMGSIEFVGAADTGERLIVIKKNGSNIPYGTPHMRIANIANNTSMILQATSHIISVNEGDYFELMVRQKSGVALSTAVDNSVNWFYMEVVE